MIVTTIDGKYPWLSVTQIFPIGQPSHDADRNIFKVMTSKTDSVAAAHDQRSPGSNQKDNHGYFPSIVVTIMSSFSMS
jgi:hypothetical protein